MINVIQIGANIGNTETDFLYKVVRKYNWSCIFVEPIPSSFELLVKNYSDLTSSFFENVAITTHSGSVTMYKNSKDLHHNQQASLNKHHWKNRLDDEIEVSCITITDLARKYDLLNKEFDLLQIDAEGYDCSILLSTDFDIIKPKKIRFETLHSPNQMLYNKTVQHLTDSGYVKIKDEYSNLVSDSGNDVMFSKIKE